MKIRQLTANEIECRIGTINSRGLTLLLYKDARVDMKMLDEIYGPANWQRKHEIVGNNLFCTVSIWDKEKKQWVSKMDVGTKSRTETQKGEASDSFKRACFNWGIGRELYTAPFIWISASKCNIQKKDGKDITYDKFSVSSITYGEDGEIVGLVIINQEGRVVYSLMDKGNAVSDSTQVQEYTKTINKELERTGVALDAVLQRYGIGSIAEMTDDTYKKAMVSLRNTKSKVA